MSRLNLIVAVSKKNYGIGKDNSMPWYIKSELKYFKDITSNPSFNNIVLMGRKTWDSLPRKPLPNRINVVISRDSRTDISVYEDTYVENNLFSAINKYMNLQKVNNKENRIYVIGGSQIYNSIMESSLTPNIYLTEIYKDYDCDVFFPKINEHLYSLVNVSKFKEEKGVFYRHKVYCYDGNVLYNDFKFWKNHEEYQYLNTMKKILQDGQENIDRTGVGTLSVFGEQFKYDLSDTFPALTTKRIFMRGIFEELMLYISGKTDNNILNQKNIHIWDGNTTREFLDKRGLSHYPQGDMGETYGFNFRHFGAKYIDCKQDYTGQGTDQLANVLNLIKNDPHSRRMIINLWNGGTLQNAALPACLCMYQFYVNTNTKRLNLQIYIRSSDFFLANNWNTCTGALLVHMICNLEDIDLTPGELTVVTGDTHLYKSHMEQVIENLKREPTPFPKLVIRENKKNIEDYVYEDFKLIDYTPQKNISAEMAV